MEKRVLDHLLGTLKNLDEEQLNKFKEKLHETRVLEGYPGIPRRWRQKADAENLSRLLFHYYGSSAVQVAAWVLENTDLHSEAQELRDVPRRWPREPISAERHFIDKHRAELIERTSPVEPVLDLLCGSVLTDEQYKTIASQETSRDKMWELYRLVRWWDHFRKDRLYEALKIKNSFLVQDILSREGQVRLGGAAKGHPDHSVGTQASHGGRRSSKDPLAEKKCHLCEKEKGVPEFLPELVSDASGKLNTYRIHLPRAGTFLCSVSELKFEVRAAVSVEYTFSSWDEHLSEAEMQMWLVAGPLFDIRAHPGGEVAAVHLPHFICLQEGKTDISEMKIAHFVDAGMTLEEPSRVTQFHAVLENPEFSLLGLLLKPILRFIPIHSVVLLYKTTRRTTTLHLYLVPNDSSVIQAIDCHEERRRSVLVEKPPQTYEPLYYGSRYVAFSSVALRIHPMVLEFSYKTPRQRQSFVDVYLGNTDGVKLSLKKEEEDVLIQEERRVPVRETEEGKRGDLDQNFRALSLGSPCESNTQTGVAPVSSEAEGPSNPEEKSEKDRTSWFSWMLGLIRPFRHRHHNPERSSGSTKTRCPTQTEGTAGTENQPSSWSRRERQEGGAPVPGRADQQGTQATPALEPHFIGQKKTVRDHLVDTLENLLVEELQKFKAKLNEIPLQEGFTNIPRGKLQEATPLDLSDLLLSYYTDCYAMEVATQVLESIHLNRQAKKLRDVTRISKETRGASL